MLHDAWADRAKSLLYFGEPVKPRGFPTLEELGRNLFVANTQYNLLDVPARKLNFRFAVAEWLWMSFGRSDVATLALFNSKMSHYSDDGVFLTGAYGPHIGAQRPHVLETLRADPVSRQAVIEIPRPKGPTKDEPCTLSLQFFLRQDLLHLLVTMRSSDVWLGIPYDVFSFTMLQNEMAGQLGVRRGWLSLNMGSSHLYQRDVPDVNAVLAQLDVWNTIRTPDLPGRAPGWLEHVLMHPASPLPDIAFDEGGPWLPYARVLGSKTSADARLILLESHVSDVRLSQPPRA